MENSYRNPKTEARKREREKQEKEGIGYSQLVKIFNNWIVPLLCAIVMLLGGIFIHLVFG